MSHAALNLRWASALIAAFESSGVKHAVLCPGSRNTPLVLALEAAESITCHTIVDERVAGFYALGLSRIDGQPVLLTCTSGSAATHFYPAIVEASASCLPLIVLAADRPPELQGCGAPQAMPQDALYGVHVRHHFNPGAPREGDFKWLATLGVQAIAKSRGQHPGPVSFNLPFAEPLWDDSLTKPTMLPIGPTTYQGTRKLSADAVSDLAAHLAKVQRGVMVIGPTLNVAVGSLQETALDRALVGLAESLGWPILTDATSSLRRDPMGENLHIGTADALVRSETFASDQRPDCVLRIGGVPTSKKVGQWLSEVPHIIIDETGQLRDPYRATATWIIADPTDTLKRLRDCLADATADPSWLSKWKQADSIACEHLEELSEPPNTWCGTVAQSIVNHLPDGALVHVASSLAIRAFNSFAPRLPGRICMTANRGVNGIDGTLSTALGQRQAWRQGPVVAVMGDLAFQHDAGALALLAEHRVTLVVLDNRGGGIFDHLPISAHPTVFESRFITEQPVDIESVARGFGVQAFSIDNVKDLDARLASQAEGSESAVLVVRIDRKDDLQAHHNTWAKIAAAIDLEAR